ncbi:MAG: hypothetical protein AB1467_00445 [Candidatus Diapherotrites archaeon]
MNRKGFYGMMLGALVLVIMAVVIFNSASLKESRHREIGRDFLMKEPYKMQNARDYYDNRIVNLLLDANTQCDPYRLVNYACYKSSTFIEDELLAAYNETNQRACYCQLTSTTYNVWVAPNNDDWNRISYYDRNISCSMQCLDYSVLDNSYLVRANYYKDVNYSYRVYLSWRNPDKDVGNIGDCNVTVYDYQADKNVIFNTYSPRLRPEMADCT